MVGFSLFHRAALGLCLVVAPFLSEAAGLGKLTVFSSLGEPLNAEIELIAPSKEELSSLSARIAPAGVYEEQGIDRVAALGIVKVELIAKADGSAMLKLTSPQPINDPFLDMLIQVEWTSGRLLREYTALLDPPGYDTQKIANAEAPVVPPANAALAKNNPHSPKGPSLEKPAASNRKTVSSRQQRAQGREEGAAQPAEPPTGPTESYKVRLGDTLNTIASHHQIDGVSLDQMLVGLYRENRQAFLGGNMNRLKAGVILRVPSPEDLQTISLEQASNEVRAQTRDWNAYRNKLAGAVAGSSPEQGAREGAAASGKITSATVDQSAAPSTGARDVVKLSKTEGEAGKLPQTPADAANAKQEDAVAGDKAIKEANERVATLEKQIQEMQKLLQIKNQTMAEAQSPTPAPAAPTPAPVPSSPQAAAPGEATPSSAVLEKTKEPPATQPPVAQDQPKKPTKKDKKPPVVAPPAAEPDLLAQMTEAPMLLASAGGGVLLLLAGWLYLRQRRKSELDNFERSILTTGSLKSNAVFGNTIGGTVDTEETAFLTDFSHSNSGEMIEASEVDPIAEAEVYMAYGRDAQAEEILRDAMVKEPTRYELHHKLLEIYAAREDAGAFETLAGELYATLGATDPIWRRIAEMGRKLDPENPLYGGSPPGLEGAASADDTPVEENPFIGIEDALVNESDAPAVGSADDAGTSLTASAVDDDTLDFDLAEFGQTVDTPGILDATDAMSDSVTPPAENFSATLDAPTVQFVEPEPFVSDAFSADAPSAIETVAEDSAGLDFHFELPEVAATNGDNPEPDSIEGVSAAEFQASASGLSLVEDHASGSDATSELSAAEEGGLDAAGNTSGDADALASLQESASPDLVAQAQELQAATPPSSMTIEPLALDGSGDIAESALMQVAENELAENDPAAPELEAEESAALDFDFDLDLGDAALQEPISQSDLPELDLSGISLDFDAPQAELTADETTELGTSENTSAAKIGDVSSVALMDEAAAAIESADVDTKLDLVSAYIDMGDPEGARELLEEILREGGSQQRERAQSMLSALS